MTFTHEFNRILLKQRPLRRDFDFQEIEDTARRYVSGRDLFLVGDIVYANLATLARGESNLFWDMFPFLVRDLRSSSPPEGWNEPRESGVGGNLRLYRPRSETTIQLDRFQTVPFIRGSEGPLTIDDYFRAAPFNVRAIAFDCNSYELVGEEGLRAIQEGTIKIHNEYVAGTVARLKSLTVDRYLDEEAQRLRLRVIP